MWAGAFHTCSPSTLYFFVNGANRDLVSSRVELHVPAEGATVANLPRQLLPCGASAPHEKSQRYFSLGFLAPLPRLDREIIEVQLQPQRVACCPAALWESLPVRVARSAVTPLKAVINFFSVLRGVAFF